MGFCSGWDLRQGSHRLTKTRESQPKASRQEDDLDGANWSSFGGLVLPSFFFQAPRFGVDWCRALGFWV